MATSRSVTRCDNRDPAWKSRKCGSEVVRCDGQDDLSEQIASAVLLGVLLGNSEPHVKASGGILIQMMPGANEHIITMIEDTIAHAPHLTSVINGGATPQDLAKLALGEIDFEVLEERDVAFRCNCSMERARTLIAALGPTEVASMLAEDNGAVMSCGFCSEVYQLDEDDLKKILAGNE